MTDFFSRNVVFVEVDYFNIPKEGQTAPGDVFLSETGVKGRRVIAALSDGLGSGIKANVLASLTAKMIIKFVLLDIPPRRAAELIVNSLPVNSESSLSYAAFTLIDIGKDFSVNIIEYDNPPVIVMRDGNIPDLKKQKIPIQRKNKKTGPQNETVCISNFSARFGDRIIFFSDGVTQAGIGPDGKYPRGFGVANVKDFVKKTISAQPDISARDLSQNIVERAYICDNGRAYDDISCAVAYFRHPRDLLVVSGPPYNPERDNEVAEIFTGFHGKKIISGGTTAQIVSRLLNREITPVRQKYHRYSNDDGGKIRVPPESAMEGADLVCEGIITLGAVSEMLLDASMDRRGESAASKMIELFINSDRILFLVGTRVNEFHQDPTMPVELEIRRNVVKKIASTLEERYLKQVVIR
ncbi:MAG: serine/threonine-protein phosphatase, partial [Spirochaetaceae bacterium]|nr:serine/threonine-protein phosphatase [Spirochaetaceae bacterium]